MLLWRRDWQKPMFPLRLCPSTDTTALAVEHHASSMQRRDSGDTDEIL